MKTITVEQFKAFAPCWLESKEGRAKFKRIAALRENWSAIDILDLTDVSIDDKLWAVLRPELIDERIMHEFACRCADMALALIEHPDARSVAAVEAKRAWLRGEIDDVGLDAARAAAGAAAWDAARAAARAAAGAAAWDAARAAARDAARAAAWDAARAAARDAARAAARDAVRDAAWDAQLEMLRGMLAGTDAPEREV